jgi:hypothetical protein
MAGRIERQEEMKEARSQKKLPAQMIQCFLFFGRHESWCLVLSDVK